jgi:hypothetical protein
MQHIRTNPTRWLLAILIGLLTVSLSFALAANGIQIGAEAGLEFEEETTTVRTRSSRRWACASRSTTA